MNPVLAKPIVIRLLPSTLLLGLLAAVTTVSALIILMLPIPLAIKCAALLIVVASSTYFIMRDALLILPRSWQIIEVDIKGILYLTNKKQQKMQVQLSAASFVHPYLTILNMQGQGLQWRLPPVILLPHAAQDIAYQDALRRLRVWMRFCKHDKTAQTRLTAPD